MTHAPLSNGSHSHATASLIWTCRGHKIDLARRPLVMGILNVTPDSFSDGGCFLDHAAAVAHAQTMLEDGADIVDIGGESTRPGAQPVDAATECERIVPVVERLTRDSDALISVDTSKAAVAHAALDAGAHIINDVSALSHDPQMADVVRDAGAGLVLMHMRGEPRTMQRDPQYGDVVAEIAAYLANRVETALQAGIAREAIVLDPGIGFGKTTEHNVAILAGIATFAALGRPVLIGLSRKSFLGKLTGREVDDRLAGSLTGLVFSVLQGAHILRVHDIKESCDAARMASILAHSQTGRSGNVE